MKYKQFIFKGILARFTFLPQSSWVVFSVAFNQPEIIKTQIKYFKKYCPGILYVLIDNSTDKSARTDLQKLAGFEGVPYYSLPKNPYKDPSKSHGAALNWVWVNIIKARKIRKFGFLDHDIFPVSSYNLEAKLGDQKIYGLIQERVEKWYIWPGFCFFNNKSCFINDLDFLPAPGVDTGGRLWETLYKKFARPQLHFAKLKNANLGISNNRQDSEVDFIDNSWLHMVNGSNWSRNGEFEEKMNLVMLRLGELEEKNRLPHAAQGGQL